MARHSESDDDLPQELQYKVIVVGDGAVGKTSLINRFTRNGFAQSYKQTIGVDFFNKRLSMPTDAKVNVTLQIWDIGGQQIGGRMLAKYIYGCAAVIFVYDITNAESFKNIDDWYTYVDTEVKAQPKPPTMFLVGNKVDLSHTRQVRIDSHSIFASERKMLSQFVSAKSGERVNSLFMRVASELSGVTMTKSDLECNEKVVKAHIVDHPSAPQPTNCQVGPQKENERCVVQ